MERPYKITAHEEHRIGRFEIICDTIELNGKQYPYSYSKAGDCVCVLPIYDENVVLIRQYRHSVNKWMLEIPAGGLDGDAPEDAARRELLEETGYIAERLISLGAYPLAHGTSTSIVHLFAAECRGKTAPSPEDTELIEVFEASMDAFWQLIREHRFTHLTGTLAWYLYQEYLKNRLRSE